MQVGLLIGCNCPRALRPLDVIVGHDDDDPYAIKTALGWGIIGPIKPNMSEGEENVTICNHIITREIGGITSNANFVVNYQAKEILTSVKKMFELDFSEYGKQPFSQEDKRCMEIVETNTHFEDGHYSIPLPLKKLDAKFPNNHTNALRRMQSLNKHFVTDENHRQWYIKFMNKILEKGYTKIKNFRTIKLSDKIVSDNLMVRNAFSSESFIVRKFVFLENKERHKYGLLKTYT